MKIICSNFKSLSFSFAGVKNLEQVQIKWNFNNGRQLVKQLKLDYLLDHKKILLSDWGLLHF